jgi:hypothetical protein
MAATYQTPGAANLEALSDYTAFLAAATFTGGVQMKVYAVNTLPAAPAAGQIAFCSNGNAGAACFVVGDGSNWKVVALGATAAAA